MENNNVSVFVIGHKKFEPLAGDGYISLQVGNGESFTKYRDNIGENISEKNPLYCELTGLYWAWKNWKESDYVGLVHYRRYFVRQRVFCTSPKNDILRKEDIIKILQKYDVIIQDPGFKNPIRSSVMVEGIPDSKQKYVLVALRDILNDNYPEFMDAFNDIAYGYMVYHANMFITSRNIFEDYCEWLFDVLSRLEDRYEQDGVELAPRQCGYVGEYLLSIYMRGKIKKEKMFYSKVVMMTDDGYVKKYPIPYGINNLLHKVLGKWLNNLSYNRKLAEYVQARKDSNLPVDDDIVNEKKYCIR